jgi:hypothetical protein
MSMMSISQSAMLPDAVRAARRFPMSSQSYSPRFASEHMNSKRAMCTMHIADKAMYASMSMAASAGILIVKTDVFTSVSLFAADLLAVAFIASVVLLSVSLLLGSLVVLLSLISLLLTCLTRLTTLESLVGQTKSKVELASTRIDSMQGD